MSAELDFVGLTREQVLAVMRQCDITDFSDDAVRQCVADAVAYNQQQHLLADAAAAMVHGGDPLDGPGPAAAPGASAPARYGDGAAEDDEDVNDENAQPTTSRAPPGRNVTGARAAADAAAARYERTAASGTRRGDGYGAPAAAAAAGSGDGVARRTAEPRHSPTGGGSPPAPAPVRVAVGQQPLLTRGQQQQQQHGAVAARRHHQTRSRGGHHTSISSVRGTPVVGALGGRTAGASAGRTPAGVDIAADGAQQQQVRPRSASAAGRNFRASPTAASRVRGGEAPLPSGRKVPGYMSDAYAEYLQQRLEDEGAFDDRPPTARATRDRIPQHQQRFEPFVAASARARTAKQEAAAADDENQPPTARDGRASGKRSGSVPAANRSASLDRSTRSASVHTSHYRDAVMEAAFTGVIYEPLASKTYLAGGFRSSKTKAPVSSPRLGPVRKVSDPVKRYQQMREAWDRDGFLRTRKPSGQRRELRWAVRCSMNDWRPETADEHHDHYDQSRSRAEMTF